MDNISEQKVNKDNLITDYLWRVCQYVTHARQSDLCQKKRDTV